MITSHLSVFKLALLLALAVVPGACKSTTADMGAATSQNITKAADEIQRGIGQLDGTLAALTNLVEKPAPDLGPQYAAFAKNLDGLDATAKVVAEAASGMESKGQAYFAEWDKQIAAIRNEDIQERSKSRRDEVSGQLSELKSAYADSRKGFNPLMNDLKDIRTALGSDLTMGGLDSVKKLAKRANSDGASVKKSLTKLAEGFRKLGVSMSKSGPPPVLPEEKK